MSRLTSLLTLLMLVIVLCAAIVPASAIPKTPEYQILAYNYQTGAWELVVKGDLIPTIDMQKRMYWCDDFLEAAAVLSSTVYSKAHWTASGTNGTATITVGAPSLMALATSGTAQNDTSILTFSSADFAIGKNPVLEFRVKLDAITNVTANFGWYVDGNDECLFRFSTATHASNIYTVYEKNNGGEVVTDTGVDIVADTWFTFRLELLSTGGFKAYINGTLVKTGAASAIRDVAFKPYFYVIDPAVAHPGRTLSIDYVKVWQDR